MIFIYRLITILLYPVFVILIYLRKLFNKEDSNRYKEKIFPSRFSPNRNLEKQLIWFHAASIGEVQSIFPLVEKINEEKKDLNFLIKLPLLPGPHYLRVKHYSPHGTGDYVMNLESSEMYDKQADDLILSKTQAYFHIGHIIYTTAMNSDNSYEVNRIQIDSVSYTLDSKRFITINVNDSIMINPSHCYVPSYGRYENLGIIQKNYIFLLSIRIYSATFWAASARLCAELPTSNPADFALRIWFVSCAGRCTPSTRILAANCQRELMKK